MMGRGKKKNLKDRVAIFSQMHPSDQRLTLALWSLESGHNQLSALHLLLLFHKSAWT